MTLKVVIVKRITHAADGIFMRNEGISDFLQHLIHSTATCDRRCSGVHNELKRSYPRDTFHWVEHPRLLSFAGFHIPTCCLFCLASSTSIAYSIMPS